jgi:hypothetical protein
LTSSTTTFNDTASLSPLEIVTGNPRVFFRYLGVGRVHIPARVMRMGPQFIDVISTPYPPCEQLLAAVVRGAELSWVAGALLAADGHLCASLTRGHGPVAPHTTTASQCSHGERGVLGRAAPVIG